LESGRAPSRSLTIRSPGLRRSTNDRLGAKRRALTRREVSIYKDSRPTSTREETSATHSRPRPEPRKTRGVSPHRDRAAHPCRRAPDTPPPSTTPPVSGLVAVTRPHDAGGLPSTASPGERFAVAPRQE